MRPKPPLVLLVALLVALVAAGAALAGNGGFAPPAPSSPNAHRITDTYYWILGFTGAIFLLVEGALVVFVVRYRRGRRSAAAEGMQVHGNTRLEIIWTVLPVLILVAIGGFIFYKLPGIRDVPTASAQGGRLDVTLEGHRYYWEFKYPNGVVAVDRLRAPAGVNVALTVVAPSSDVIHSWWIPKLGGKTDAIPGRVNHAWFNAEPGTYFGQCAEFCGIQHAVMRAEVEVMPREEFDRWLSAQASEQKGQGPSLGEETWIGVCAKCHAQNAGGGIGPAIRGNPLLRDRQGLYQLVHEGRGRMPPVAQRWPDAQFDALLAYVGKTFSQAAGGAPSGG